MVSPNTFEEASTATEEMFDGQVSLTDTSLDSGAMQTADAPAVVSNQTIAPGNNDNTESPARGTSENEELNQQPENEQPDAAIEQAAQTAEIAAQAAADKNVQLQQVMTELETLKLQNQQLQETIDEISKKNAEDIVEKVLEPPVLDINSLAFADEETQKKAMAKYAQELSDYNREQLIKEMSPALEFAKKGMRDAETKEVVSALSKIPELANIENMLPKLDRIIANNEWLQSDDMPLDERYINAYAIAKGIDSINNPSEQTEKEPTPEELLALYNNNPAFQELVEKQRIDSIKQSQQVPPFSASSGAVNAALNIKEKPQTLEEASKRTREMFGEM